VAIAVPKAIVFDTFGSVVDWRGSVIEQLAAFGERKGIRADWTELADAWRGEYGPSMDRVRRGEQPFVTLDELHHQSLAQLVSRRGIVGVTAEDLDELTLVWHHLRPWPDSVAGLTRLKSKFIIGPLSNGNVALLVNLAKYAALPWDVVAGSDVFGHYKPDPETYLGVCRLLRLEPGQVMLAAAHSPDLAAAQSYGLSTAFFPRPDEFGDPERARADLPAPGMSFDYLCHDIEDLAVQLGV
jgi:2-haloacid dehalogenase